VDLLLGKGLDEGVDPAHVGGSGPPQGEAHRARISGRR
jgi:hypothetical protein